MAIQGISLSIPSYSEGRRPSSRTLDGLRWTPMLRRRTRQRRTAKACGPDVATLASMHLGAFDFPGRNGGKRAVLRGELAISRKATAQGMSDALRCPVCSCAPFLVQTAHETAGAARIRHSLRPLDERARKFLPKLGRCVPRDREAVSPVILRCEPLRRASKDDGPTVA